MKLLKRYLIPILLTFSTVFPFIFYSANIDRQKNFSTLERIGYAISTPFEGAFTWIGSTSKHVFANYIDLVNARAEMTKIRQENEILRIQTSIFSEISRENQRLRKLLGFAKSSTIDFATCEVVGADPSFLFESVRIGCGSDLGIALGMGVVSGQGVVGVVTRSLPKFSDVLLITDLNSNLDVIVARNRRRGILAGHVGRAMKFKYSERGTAIQVGDEVITSGFTGPFPPGLSVGTVTRVSRDTDGVTQSMDVQPTSDIAKTFEVLVLKTTGREFDIIQKLTGSEERSSAPDSGGG